MSKKLTSEEFIVKSIKMHGDEYDYSLVEYVNNRTKVKIICPIHGVFEIAPKSHLRQSGGSGCVKCSIENQKTNMVDLICDFNDIHNFKYDYSLMVYENAKTKIKIICKKHGVFEQTPTNHKRGSGCPLCSYENKLITQNEIIKKFNKTHRNRYDYSLVEYCGTEHKVKIKCPEHGIFEQTPHAHISGQGCPFCQNNLKHSNNTFIQKSKEVHGDKYNYSLVKYKNNKTNVKIICVEHGVFEQRPDIHLQGQGCPICAVKNRTLKSNEVIEKFNDIHIEYDYSLVEYKNTYTKVKIICKKHGIFEQTPHAHLKGHGCPLCNESKGEREIAKILINENIKYEREKRFSDCKDKYTLPFDFYLPEYDCCIEFDGMQHYYNVPHWNNNLKYVKMHDNIKNNYCINNNIKLLRIKYNNKNIKESVLNFLK